MTHPSTWPSPAFGPDKPLKPFGSALEDRTNGTIPKLEPITERPVRLKGEPPCPVCGETRFYCGHEGEEE